MHLLSDSQRKSLPPRQHRPAMEKIPLNRLATKASSHQHLLAIPLRDADLLPPSLTRLHAVDPARLVRHRWTRPARLQAPSTHTLPNPPSIQEARAAASDHHARCSHGERLQTASPSSARPGLSFRARGATGTKQQSRYYGRFVVRLYNTIRPHSSLGYRPPAPEAIAPCSLGSATLHPANMALGLT